ncbi:uncharacterized protein CMC5_060490 [Chondromyces crocatus]|uniref:L,D-TPase catalytic domain-containing protein n=2 Tax=Chondromyces crocatus TaxID=52 RepID=A0A0K1EMH6_CHOCO|nr:uncharacterized protein CMC5_060490 [Chondromyces crocatus]
MADAAGEAPAGDAAGTAAADATPRIYSKARFAWIAPAPRPSKGWLGYLGLGGSVAVRGASLEAARVHGSGCDAWYAVEPVGYVCAGSGASVDPNDPAVVALRDEAPKLDSPWPYQYAESLGAPRYVTVPSAEEQRRKEWDLAAHLEKTARAREAKSEEEIRAIDKHLVGVDLRPTGVPQPELFSFGGLVREARPRVVDGSTVAYTQSFDADGRSWVVTSDQAIMPRDRLRPYPRSEFQGVWLRDGVALPIAYIRKSARPTYRRTEAGAFEPTGEELARLSWVGLTGRTEGEGKARYVETKQAGVWLLESDTTVLEQAEKIPFTKAAEPGAPPRKWLEVSVLGGWLIAYEEATPVFATLISPGRGGIPTKGVAAIETAATPTGTFRVDGKFRTATMVSSTNDLIVHSEVQYVLNFSGPHALHGAYWHDAWGEPKSGGCVNLAPIDAKQIFAWTDPPVPEGWHGMRAVSEMGRSTVVKIHR